MRRFGGSSCASCQSESGGSMAHACRGSRRWLGGHWLGIGPVLGGLVTESGGSRRLLDSLAWCGDSTRWLGAVHVWWLHPVACVFGGSMRPVARWLASAGSRSRACVLSCKKPHAPGPVLTFSIREQQVPLPFGKNWREMNVYLHIKVYATLLGPPRAARQGFRTSASATWAGLRA